MTPSRGETVLLVEGDEAVRQLACRALEEVGYCVLSATSSYEAMRICRKHGDSISALVADIARPGTGGAALARRLRQAHPNVKVLYTSGYLTDLEEMSADTADAGDKPVFLEKPFSPEVLTREVSKMLARSAAL